MGRAERRDIIQRIEAGRQSRVLCYLTSDRPNAGSMIQKDAIPYFYAHLRQIGDADRLDVFVVSMGGDTLAAFGMARLAREFSQNVCTLVPDKCLSAGTLFALGANQIVMTRGAMLSPIDPSVGGPLNPAVELVPGLRQLVPLSVESVAGYLDLVTEEWGLRGEEALSAAFKHLVDRINPVALGNVFRAREQIERLAHTLLTQHRHDDRAIERIIETLTKELGSHDYLISRREARELLGAQVSGDDGVLEGLIAELYEDFAAEMHLGLPYDPNLELHAAQAVAAAALAAQAPAPAPAPATPGPGGPSAPAPIPPPAPALPQSIRLVKTAAIIESFGMGHASESEVEIQRTQGPGTPMMMPGVGMVMQSPQTAVREEVVRSAWRRYA